MNSFARPHGPRLLAGTLVTLSALCPSLSAAVRGADPDPGPVNRSAGFVFVMTNEAADNRVAVLHRSMDGTLRPFISVRTGGNGTGSVLDSQGALLLSPDRRHLYVCNPGSDQISVFELIPARAALRLVQLVPSAGDMPVSLTLHGDVLYVLNAGPAATNVAGFHVDGEDGRLTSLPQSQRMLSTLVGAPAQVRFSPDGAALVVTHKNTDVLRPPFNIIDILPVSPEGIAGAPVPQRSNGIRPFGFAFRADGSIVVSEAFNGVPGRAAVSSYALEEGGTLRLLSGSVANGQTASCWVVLTRNGRYAYVTNTGSGTITSYIVGVDGELVLLKAEAAPTGRDTQPVDVDVSADGRFLYVLLTGSAEVASFAIHDNGDLAAIDVDPAVPAKGVAQGLVAF
jgi:6-phosphogluconolactonase (cycloisomerase 2 family)